MSRTALEVDLADYANDYVNYVNGHGKWTGELCLDFWGVQ